MSILQKKRGNFWKSLQGKIIVITAVVGGIAALIGNLQTISDFVSGLFSEKKISITGIVLNNDKTPAQNAYVTLYLSSKSATDSIVVVSDEKGIFNFTGLENKYDSFSINVSWRGKVAFYKNEFSDAAFGKEIMILLPNAVLPTSSNPLSFTYYSLKGHTIDYLLEGKIDPSWVTKLSKPYIITNDIFKKLSKLREGFNYRNDPNNYTEGIPPEEYIKKGETTELIDGNKMLSHYMVDTDDPEDSNHTTYRDKFITVNESEVSLFVDQSVKEKLKQNRSQKFTYTWFPTRADLLNIQKAELLHYNNLGGNDVPTYKNILLSFLLDVTRNYYPDSLIEAAISCDLACGEDEGGDLQWMIELSPPSLSLKIVLIENSASQTVTLGNFYVLADSASGLRTDNINSITELSARNYFPKQKLKKDETIVLPLQIILKTSKKHEYFFGPEELLKSIEIDNDNYAVRMEDTRNIFMYESVAQIGSCPYIYTYSTQENKWLLESHILYGFSSKEKENENSLVLRRFTGQVELRENDPEISYIDYLCIKHVLPDGTIKTLSPDNLPLIKKDGSYLVLKRGDRLLLNFPLEETTKGVYSVVSYGYYTALKIGGPSQKK